MYNILGPACGDVSQEQEKLSDPSTAIDRDLVLTIHQPPLVLIFAAPTHNYYATNAGVRMKKSTRRGVSQVRSWRAEGYRPNQPRQYLGM
jgi:hypothetical protein